MDKYLKSIMDKRIVRTMENLKKNRMQAYYVETGKQVTAQIAALMTEGETVAVGGSMTLFETGVIDFLRSGRYHFLDRYAENLTREQLDTIYHQSFMADTYLTSSNAITEEGELYNVDGNGNRVAAMIYGPKSVIVVAGMNKIVKDMIEAENRLKCIAAPANTSRLQSKTPCVETGSCQDCKSKQRICCSYTVLRQQRNDRIKVIIVGEAFGY